jgi:hypothetical protein
MPLRRFTRMLLVAIATLLVAAPVWALLAYLSTGPLGALYGWSGHPSLPNAPTWVYVALYLAVLPIVSLAGAGAIVRAVARQVSRRRGAAAPGGPRSSAVDAEVEGPPR